MENDKSKYITPEMLKYFDCVKDRIICRMVNIERNRDYLTGKPFTQAGDMAATYHVHLGSSGGKSRSFAVTDIHMRRYGITRGELHTAAVENMGKRPFRFNTLYGHYKYMQTRNLMKNGHSREEAETGAGPGTDKGMAPDDGGAYVLTNETCVNGAVQMLNPEALDKVSKELGGNFFIVPSSVHEVLVMPKILYADYREIENMLRDVNMSGAVAPEEMLSDHVYEYDPGAETITLCDRPEERITVKLHDPGRKRGKGHLSLVADLEEKKKQAAGRSTPHAVDRSKGMEL